MWLVAFLCFLPCALSLTADEIQVFHDAGFEVVESSDYYHIYHVGIPDHDYGPFPAVGNPNTVSEQHHNITVPKVPQNLETPGCLPLGKIGLAISGGTFYNPYSALGLNAVEGDGAETFDDCSGHPPPSGDYHYHKYPNCIQSALYGDVVEADEAPEKLVGVALDGYPVYTTRDLNTQGLDECHGKGDGADYRYYITIGFPYIMGCLKGHVHASNIRGGGMGGGMGGQMPPNGGPPPNGQGPPPNGGPPPGGMAPGGMAPGGGADCVYANVSQPTGWPDLTAGEVNNGVTIVEDDMPMGPGSDGGDGKGDGDASSSMHLLPHGMTVLMTTTITLSLSTLMTNS